MSGALIVSLLLSSIIVATLSLSLPLSLHHSAKLARLARSARLASSTRLARLASSAARSGQSLTSVSMSSSVSSSSSMTTTLGPYALRRLVSEACRAEMEAAEDGGEMLWLEHVNIVVGDMDIAKKFYVDFLGLTPDKDSLKHFNLGQQQFHLAATEEPPQRITGSIGLTVPSLSNIRLRAAQALKDLNGTQFALAPAEIDHEEHSKHVLTVTCPWGNIFHLYDIAIDAQPFSSSSSASSSLSDKKMVKLHSHGQKYGPHRMAVRGQPGIRYIEIACPVGTLSAITNFYKQTLHSTITITHNHTTDSNNNNNNAAATVPVGPNVHLTYIETPSLTTNMLQQMKGIHICIYVSQFRKLYHDLQRQNKIWTNPRFTHLDTCDTWEEAWASRTLRFKDLVLRDYNNNNTANEESKVVFELEHETRPTSHGQFMKVPYYIPN